MPQARCAVGRERSRSSSEAVTSARTVCVPSNTPIPKRVEDSRGRRETRWPKLSYTGPPREVVCPTWPRAGILVASAHCASCDVKTLRIPSRRALPLTAYTSCPPRCSDRGAIEAASLPCPPAVAYTKCVCVCVRERESVCV